MSDLISRAAALDAVIRFSTGDGASVQCTDLYTEINNLPSAQPTLYGYQIEHLAYIARVMQKEGVTAEYAVRTFDDMSRATRMTIEEAQQKVEEALNERFNQQTGGD